MLKILEDPRTRRCFENLGVMNDTPEDFARGVQEDLANSRRVRTKPHVKLE